MIPPGGATAEPHQIIIVRRNHDHEEAHHGGVWKIAFADFMTALMAFFLVMWLTNASDDATKKQIAQYFNPIKLNSATPAAPGITSERDAPPQPTAGADTPTEEPDSKPVSGTLTGGQEDALFRDPYAVLAEIVAEGGPGTREGAAGEPDGSGLPGLKGGEAYRDPFDPASWQLQPNTTAAVENPTPLAPGDFQTLVAAPPARPQGSAPAGTEAASPGAAAPKAADAGAGGAKAADAGKPGAAAATAAADALRREIDAAVARETAMGRESVEVTAKDGGVMISLADNVAAGMFQIGSAKPTADAVRLLEKIARIIGARKGQIVIRGHTDARPYKGAEYDNWRLSTARAHMAYYMLLRGGLDEARVSSIEGFADRDPQVPADPDAAANRRIEIFLREPAA